MSNCDKLNTHHYDGQVYIPEEVRILSTSVCFLDLEKKMFVNEFVIEVSAVDIPEKNDISLSFLNAIVRDWGNNSNFDTTNNFRAEDVLFICVLVWNNIKTLRVDESEKDTLIKDFCRELFIQLSDMQTGPCPQGRVTRLWQVAESFYEFIEDKLEKK
jgi:hypothetical protein